MLKKSLLVLLLLVSCTCISYAQVDSLKYTLTTGKIKVIKKSGQRWLEVPVKVTNITNDTLRYATMTCSWQDFYSVNNSLLEIEHVDCDKNTIDRITLAPGKINTVLLKLHPPDTEKKLLLTFRIGHNLVVLDKLKSGRVVREEMKKSTIKWTKTVHVQLK